MNNKWNLIRKSAGSTDPYGAVLKIHDNRDSMSELRSMFPMGKADDLNFVLFSTSGTNGTSDTIEDVEAEISKRGYSFDGLTFIVVSPRIVSMRYGRAYPENQEDIAFLKGLRASSIAVVTDIGKACTSN